MKKKSRLQAKACDIDIGKRRHSAYRAFIQLDDSKLVISGETDKFDSVYLESRPSGVPLNIRVECDSMDLIQILFQGLSAEKRALLHRCLHDQILDEQILPRGSAATLPT